MADRRAQGKVKKERMRAGLFRTLPLLMLILMAIDHCITAAQSNTEIDISSFTANATNYGCVGSVHDCLIADQSDLGFLTDPYLRRMLANGPYKPAVDKSKIAGNAVCHIRNVRYSVKECINTGKPGTKAGQRCGPYTRDNPCS